MCNYVCLTEVLGFLDIMPACLFFLIVLAARTRGLQRGDARKLETAEGQAGEDGERADGETG
jgi:hypothetical protein